MMKGNSADENKLRARLEHRPRHSWPPGATADWTERSTGKGTATVNTFAHSEAELGNAKAPCFQRAAHRRESHCRPRGRRRHRLPANDFKQLTGPGLRRY